MVPAPVPGAEDESDEELADCADAQAWEGVKQAWSKADDIAGTGSLYLERLENEGSLVGRAWRSAITGEVHIRRTGDFQDFTFVHLGSKRFLKGSLKELAQDHLLFRPYVMTYRTWIYHQLYLSKTVLDTVHENAMLEFVLKHWCIDAPVKAGRWSPLMFFAPMVLALCLTSDTVVVVTALLVNFLIYVQGGLANNPANYRKVRLWTLPVRLLFIGILILRLTDNILAVVGSAMSLMICGADLLLGDCCMLLYYRFTCQYELLRILPNRVFVVRRIGAAHLDDAFGPRGCVPESVSLCGNWDHDLHLIAEIFGLIVELRPVSVEEWEKVYDWYQTSDAPLRFVSLETFGPDGTTAAGPLGSAEPKAGRPAGPGVEGSCNRRAGGGSASPEGAGAAWAGNWPPKTASPKGGAKARGCPQPKA